MGETETDTVFGALCYLVFRALNQKVRSMQYDELRLLLMVGVGIGLFYFLVVCEVSLKIASKFPYFPDSRLIDAGKFC
jgi:hypothetical protein